MFLGINWTLELPAITKKLMSINYHNIVTNIIVCFTTNAASATASLNLTTGREGKATCVENSGVLTWSPCHPSPWERTQHQSASEQSNNFRSKGIALSAWWQLRVWKGLVIKLWLSRTTCMSAALVLMADCCLHVGWSFHNVTECWISKMELLNVNLFSQMSP